MFGASSTRYLLFLPVNKTFTFITAAITESIADLLLEFPGNLYEFNGIVTLFNSSTETRYTIVEFYLDVVAQYGELFQHERVTNDSLLKSFSISEEAFLKGVYGDVVPRADYSHYSL